MAKGDHRVGVCRQGCHLWPFIVNSPEDRYCKEHGLEFQEVVGLRSDGDEIRRMMRLADGAGKKAGHSAERRHFASRQQVARLLKRSL